MRAVALDVEVVMSFTKDLESAWNDAHQEAVAKRQREAAFEGEWTARKPAVQRVLAEAGWRSR